MKLKRILALALTGAMLTLSACGGSGKPADGAQADGADKLRDFTVVLDWYPNAIHAFLYNAI